MSEKYKLNDPNGTYFITLSVVGWIDLFTRVELKQVIIESLKHCQKEKGLIITLLTSVCNACKMPLMSLNTICTAVLGTIIQIRRDYWILNFYNEGISTRCKRALTLIVDEPQYYLYSSARDYHTNPRTIGY